MSCDEEDWVLWKTHTKYSLQRRIFWQNLLPALQFLKVTPLKVWWRRYLILLTLLELNFPVPWFQQRSLTDLLLVN